MIKFIREAVFFSSFPTLFEMNKVFFIFTGCAAIIFIMYFIFLELGNKLLWTYCSLLPSLILIIIRFQNTEVTGVEAIKLNGLDYLILFIMLIILLVPVILQLLILNNYSKSPLNGIPEFKIEQIINSGISSNKIMEYFVVLILPFITIGYITKDLITMLYVLIVLLIIFLRLKIFYFNLPLMIFYDVHEVKLSNGKNYYLISKGLEVRADNSDRKIIVLSEELSIAYLKK